MGVERVAPDVLSGLRESRPETVDRLVPVLYDELRRLAHARLGAFGAELSLNTTALVHEVYPSLWTSREPIPAIERTFSPWRRLPCDRFSSTARGRAGPKSVAAFGGRLRSMRIQYR